MKKKVKWIAGCIAAAVLIGYVIFSSVQPLETELYDVQPQTVAQSFTEEGLVESATEQSVYSLIDGQIAKLMVVEGQRVRAGDVLARIDSTDLEYQLQQLQAQKKSLLGQEKKSYREMQQQLGQLKGQLASIEGQEKQSHAAPHGAQLEMQQLAVAETKRQLEASTEDYRNIEALYESGAVSKNEMNNALQAVQQLENQLKQQEQALKLIEEQADPLPGTDQYFGGLKQAVQTQIDVLAFELNRGSAEAAGTKQYYEGLIESLDAQIKHLTYQNDNKQIVSPIDGIVKEVSEAEGAMVSRQTPLMTVSSAEDFEVQVYLLPEEVIQVEEGMNVMLIQKRKDGDVEFPGTVKAIAPAAEEKLSALGLTQQKVKVTVKPGEPFPELRPGYALDVRFTTLEQPKALAVPKAALFPYEEGDAVFVARNGKAEIQRVEKGMETDELTVIAKGLSAGDRVITQPEQEGLKQGKKVK